MVFLWIILDGDISGGYKHSVTKENDMTTATETKNTSISPLHKDLNFEQVEQQIKKLQTPLFAKCEGDLSQASPGELKLILSLYIRRAEIFAQA